MEKALPPESHVGTVLWLSLLHITSGAHLEVEIDSDASLPKFEAGIGPNAVSGQ